MSTPVEMVANVTPTPPPAHPDNKSHGVSREDTDKPSESAPVADAASIRAAKVSMAEDDMQTAPEGMVRESRPNIDIMV